MRKATYIILALSIFLLASVSGGSTPNWSIACDQNITLLRPSACYFWQSNNLSIVFDQNITNDNVDNQSVSYDTTPGNIDIYVTASILTLIIILFLYMKKRRECRTPKNKMKCSPIEENQESQDKIRKDEKKKYIPSLYECIEQNIDTYPYSVGKYVIGSDHVKNDIPCQDRCGYKAFLPGCGIVVVADGLGSRSKSDMGASIAVNSIINFLDETITINQKGDLEYGKILKEAIICARKSLENCANEEQCNLDDLACTIIIVIVNKDSIVVAHIGDGAVVAKTDKCIMLISGPGECEYVNEVIPITSKKWENALRITPKISNVECIATFTDGCQGACLSKAQCGLLPHSGFFEPLFSHVGDVVRRADNIMICKNDIEHLLSQKMNSVSEDDKTIVISILR